MPFDCDVVVIGGGPAGSAAAAFLARSHVRVVLLERDTFPRFHIGESLLASVNEVFEAIGATDLIRRAGFPQKWGATFITPDGGVERFADFAISGEIPFPQTWQVPRAQFDDLLLRHASACGADVRERHRVLDIAFDDTGVSLTYRREDAPDGTAADVQAVPLATGAVTRFAARRSRTASCSGFRRRRTRRSRRRGRTDRWP